MGQALGQLAGQAGIEDGALRAREVILQALDLDVLVFNVVDDIARIGVVIASTRAFLMGPAKRGQTLIIDIFAKHEEPRRLTLRNLWR